MTQVEFGVLLLVIAAVIGIIMGTVSGFFTWVGQEIGDFLEEKVTRFFSSYLLWFSIFIGCIITGLYLILT